MRHRFGIRQSFVAALVLALGGCSLPIHQQKLQTTYRLNPVTTVTAAVQGKDGAERAVAVRLPTIEAASGFDTAAMVYSRDHQTLARYRDNRWVAPPAILIGDAVEQSLLRQPWVDGVLHGNGRLQSSLTLQCRLNRLEHDVVAPDRGQVHLALACRLSRHGSDKPVAHWEFAKSRPISVNDAAHFAAAAQQLLDSALDEIIQRTRAQVVALPANWSASPHRHR